MGTMAIDGILHFMTQPPLGRQPEILPPNAGSQSPVRAKSQILAAIQEFSIASIVCPSPMEIATWACGGRPAGSGISPGHSVVPAATDFRKRLRAREWCAHSLLPLRLPSM